MAKIDLKRMPGLNSEVAKEVASVFRSRSVFRSTYQIAASGTFEVGKAGTVTVTRGESPREDVTVNVTGSGCTVTEESFTDGPGKEFSQTLSVTPSATSFTVTLSSEKDGRKYELGTYKGTAKPAETFNPTTVSPTDKSQVEQLSEVTLTFESKPKIVKTEVTTNHGESTATLSAGDGNTAKITLSPEVTSETESVTITVQAGSITDESGAHCNKKLTYTYTVQASEAV